MISGMSMVSQGIGAGASCGLVKVEQRLALFPVSTRAAIGVQGAASEEQRVGIGPDPAVLILPVQGAMTAPSPRRLQNSMTTSYEPQQQQT